MIKKIILTIIGMIIFGYNSLFALEKSYYTNYRISGSWDEVMTIIEKIKAYQNTKGAKEIPSSYYVDLNKKFNSIFKHFPKNPNYNVIYQKCLITSESLSKKYSYEDYTSFEDQCVDGLNNIIKEINSKYTVEANVNVKTNKGSAPFTVTFDGTRSRDPSVETIPEANYYWYYKDMDGRDIAIGKGPVVNHTFNRAGTYAVHLTVRSVNYLKGVLDGSKDIYIEVTPEAARIKVYANGKELVETSNTKFSTQEASQGILFDGSGTVPLGKRIIESYKRTIDSGSSFKVVENGKGNPKPYRAKLVAEGRYNVSLRIEDNEGNVVEKTYGITINDPIAKIKLSPNVGKTTTTYTFDANASYTIDGKIKSYKWILYDPNGSIIETYDELKTFQKKFNIPGQYTANLTVVTDYGEEDSDVLKFNVESSDPIAAFTIEPIRNWKYPSQFILNAASSYDYDVLNNIDSLKYEWRLMDTNVAELKVYDDGKKAMVTFNEIGTHKVRLIVTDKYGKMSEIDNEIKVESTLRPEIVVPNFVVEWGTPMTFSVTSNKNLSFYQWDFGDKKSIESNENTVEYAYNTVGVFNVILKVKSPSGDSNEVMKTVFVGEKGYPIAAYRVYYESDTTLFPDTYCSIKKPDGNGYDDYPAYTIERYQKFFLSSNDSVNSKGTKQNLNVYFKPNNESIIKKPIIDYNFTEMGCTYIDFHIEDTTVGKSVNERIRFKVKNALPRIGSLMLSYPQYGNETGIGFNENNQKDIFQNEYDPLIVKVIANGTKDVDGQITHYKWYYYEKNNPENYIEVKITPNIINYAIFSIPRVVGEYTFGVEVFDHDGGSIRSEDAIGQGPLIVFAPDTKNPDIPLVSLTTSAIITDVGKEIEFRVSSEILSSRSDFKTNRVIKYDFDGDGNYDLTTKKDRVTFAYKEPGKYRPKAKVIYRGYAGVNYGEKIEVKKGLKPILMYDSNGGKIIVRDESFGEIENRELCLNISECSKNNNYVVVNTPYFEYDYTSNGTYYLRLLLKDKYGNEAYATGKVLINVDREEIDDLRFLSIPQPEITKSNNYKIYVGNALNNSVLYNITSNLEGDCYIDMDITLDSDGDGNPEGDKDYQCDKLNMINYKSGNFSTISRIYYGSGENKITRDIEVEFLNVDDSLIKQYQEHYDKLNIIINELEEGEDQDLIYLKTLLINLKSSLGDNLAVSSLIIQIYDWLEQNLGVLDDNLEIQIEKVLKGLTDGATKAALGGGSDYEIAKANILIFIPEEAKDGVEKNFEYLEQSNGNRDEIKKYINDIMQIAVQQTQSGNLDETDLELIKGELCIILSYYSVESDKCGNATSNCGDGVCSESEDCSVCEEDCGKCKTGTSIVGSVIKIVIIILLILFVIFIILTIIFAVKAKKQQNIDENVK